MGGVLEVRVDYIFVEYIVFALFDLVSLLHKLVERFEWVF